MSEFTQDFSQNDLKLLVENQEKNTNENTPKDLQLKGFDKTTNAKNTGCSPETIANIDDNGSEKIELHTDSVQNTKIHTDSVQKIDAENSEDLSANSNLSESENKKSEISKNEIAKLHRECAKYRTALNTTNDEKANLQKQFDELKIELEKIVNVKKEQEILFKLEKAGCLKPKLVLSEIPADCEDLDGFIKNYKNENQFLFERKKQKHGFSFRGSRSSNYTTSQQMNNYIRSALGR